MGDAVAVTDEDVLSVEVVGGTMACCLIRLLVTLKEQLSTSIAHVYAVRIEIRPVNGLAPTHSDAISALAALAAVVPRHKEIIPSPMLIDERSLNGVGASIV